MNDHEFFYQKLELTTILEELSSYAILPPTRTILLNTRPTSDLDYLNTELNQVDEGLRIVLRMGRAPLLLSSDLIPLLKIVKKGAVLNPLEIYQVFRLYETIKALERHHSSLMKHHILINYYTEYIKQLIVDHALALEIERSIDEAGTVLDDASLELRTLRIKLRQMDGKIKNKLQEIIARDADKLSQAVYSLRGDRYVVPIRAEYKNSFKGIIHDVSTSGQTFFIEPLVIVDLMSKKAELENLEKKEITRILVNLSKQIALNVSDLEHSYQILITIDRIFAKAKLAEKQNANRPFINNLNQFKLINARHPLLRVKKVIPNNIQFRDQHLGIIITGPNTGGKTVLLKTVGLLVLMTKCGLLIPADEKSNIMIYDQVYCDIGDDQSIQANLSTFSSHMNNIINIINLVTPTSLVLLDEIGAGTDPVEGSNLALAILEYFLTHKISFITTTHYPELKAFAYRHPQVVNASMEFNQNTLSPTYRLILGRPGASNAFNIAHVLGLKPAIIERAKDMTSTSQTEVSLLIAKLEEQSQILDDEINKVNLEKASFNQLTDDYRLKLDQLEKEKSAMIAQVKKETELLSEKILTDAKKILEEVKSLKHREIKHHEMIEIKQKMDELEQIEEVKIVKTIDKLPEVGDHVYLAHYEQYGTIIKQLKPKLYLVEVGNITVKLKADEFKIALLDESKARTAANKRSILVKTPSPQRISLSLDLRGKRFEDAKLELDRYFDDLLLAQIKQVSIIHGYGTGTIRELVQNYLKNHPLVLNYRYGGSGEGGMGATIVNLK